MQVFIQKQLNAEQPYQWYLGSDQALAFERFSGELSDLQEFSKNYQHIKQWVLLLPAVDCIVKYLPFTEQERKHIAKAIPYLLEETVLTDVDDLHLISDKPEKNQVAIAAVDKQLLNQALDTLESIGIRPTSTLPEQVLFASQGIQNELAAQGSDAVVWQLIVLDEYYLLRAGKTLYALELAQISLTIELLSAQLDEASKPSSIQVFAHEGAAQELIDVLPEAWSSLVDLKSFDYAEAVQGVTSHAVVLQKYNFLKGQFARTVNWLSIVKPWRSVLIALCAVYCVQVGFMWVEKDRLQTRFDAQQIEKDALFREAIPRGNIVDHQKQLQRMLNAVEGGGSSDALFIEWLDRMGSVMAAAGVQSFNSIQYESKSTLMRLDFLVDDYDTLQKIITQLKEKGFEVDIQNSNAQDAVLRAKLNVKG
ncbi:MAG: hypothetical protein KAG18_01970 [Sinobacterium sp.]|nr:hypothetical protein [Sinobacterium sp.]